jgi:hypothetical protein
VLFGGVPIPLPTVCASDMLVDMSMTCGLLKFYLSVNLFKDFFPVTYVV